MTIFAIKSANDFYAKAKEDIDASIKEMDNSNLAMNAILSTYHLHEWIWARWLKGCAPLNLGAVFIRSKKDFLEWLDHFCPHFSLLQELANGSKHCSPVVSTGKISGYGSGPYGVGPYGKPYLLIDRGDSLPLGERWLVATDMLLAVQAFWNNFFHDYGPIP